MMKKRKIVFLILTVCWMVLIFSFSAKNADQSEKDSGRVGRIVGEWFVPGFQDWGEAKQAEFIEAIDFPVRKTAHATEYAVLGVFVFGTVYEAGKGRIQNLVVPWLIATGYAATDEFHQLFVPGRSGQIRDVMIDSCGVLAGVLLVSLIIRIRKNKCKKISKKRESEEQA